VLETLPEWLTAWLSEDWYDKIDYLTNGKHLAWYASVRFTLIAGFAGAALAVMFGLIGASLKQARFPPFRMVGTFYTTIVRGVPDVLFFLFFPLAFEQAVEYFFSRSSCSSEELANATS
jgi:polar amino acid transport system permease protein